MILTLRPTSEEPGPWSALAWTPGTPATPDVGMFQRTYPGPVVVFEIEVSRASIERGHKAFGTLDHDVLIQPASGWEMVKDLDRPRPKRHYPMHAWVQRVAIYPSDMPELKDEAEVLAACPRDSTRWRRSKAAFGPALLPYPNLSPVQFAAGKQRVAGWLAQTRMLLKTGAVGPVEDSRDGLLTKGVSDFRPWGPPDPGEVAGSGIEPFPGYEGCPEYAPYAWLKSCCNHERRWHAYDRKDGSIITADDYPDPGPMYQQGTGDPNNGWLPEFVGVASHPDPIIPSYDVAHSIRGFSDLIALTEISDSPMAQRMLHSQAAQFRLQYSERGPHPTPNYTPPSLRTSLGWAKNAPHTGHFGQDTGRQHGWRALLIAQSVKRGDARNLPWCKMMVELAETAAMPNGIFSRCASDQPSSVWYDPVHDTAHSFEVPYFWFGVTACARQAGLPVPSAMLKAFEELYEKSPMLPYYSGHGPAQYAYVAKRGGAPYSNVPGGKDNIGDSTHVLLGCALAASEDHNVARWKAAGQRVDAYKVSQLETTTDLREGAGFLAQMQRS